MSSSRKARRRSVTIQPNLVGVYQDICKYYGVKDDASAIFNLGIYTIGKALAARIKEQEGGEK